MYRTVRPPARAIALFWIPVNDCNPTTTSLFRFLRPALSALGAAACLALPLRARDYAQDTLAVRILPDQHGLTATPVTQVITAEA